MPHPFNARDHGNSTFEVIAISPSIGPTHSTIEALQAFAPKFKHLIFTIDTCASVEFTVLPRLLEVSTITHMLLVTDNPTQHLFAKSGIPLFRTVADALRAIKGTEIQEVLLKKLDQIPQLNTTAFQLLQQLNKQETTFADLEKTVANEAGLSAQILKTANSSFFMRRTRADTLAVAMTYLGMEGIKQILVYNVFQGLNNYWGAQEEVMKHGRHCAHLAGFIATTGKVDALSVSKVKLAGLLHDIGSLALAFYYPKEFKDVKTLIKEKSKCTFEAELEIFGVEHQQLGKKLAEKWGFPEYLSTVVGDHHHLSGTTFDKLTLPVFCANGFLNQTIEQIPFTPYYQKLREYFSGQEERVSMQELHARLTKELETIKP
jgi:putative nucleotidyltransferase with HDIG domain